MLSKLCTITIQTDFLHANLTPYLCELRKCFILSKQQHRHQFLIERRKNEDYSSRFNFSRFLLWSGCLSGRDVPSLPGKLPAWLDGWKLRWLGVRTWPQGYWFYWITILLLRCLLFNATKGMTWHDSVKYCKSAYPNGTLVEILTVEVWMFLLTRSDWDDSKNIKKRSL